MTPVERLASLNQQYQDAGTRLSVAAENGLFIGQGASNCAKIETGLTTAEAALTANNPGKAELELYKLEVDYYHAVAAKGLVWRLVHVYGVIHLICSFLGAYAAFRVAAYFFTWDGSPDLKVLLAGIGGASLNGLYFTIEKCNRESLRRVWIVQMLIGPFVGLLFAIFVHYTFAGGLALLSKQPNAESLNKDAIIWLSLYAGFRWKWTLTFLDRVSTKFDKA
ncbi:MAG: hypothetical protein ABI222_13325 [Opitutaceae bacterium]